ncbi:uncharacterized protein YALI1_F14160g [Yarrowia lipolytica]|uniref:Uncharacterized protein n=1 Tax=Yarrowia lipolytica TaxID=4952 RepID=A0A1D8NMU9_YARLL|nr:hypothetical protein YALI1_F14160g [Yarrowia lipolytica]
MMDQCQDLDSFHQLLPFNQPYSPTQCCLCGTVSCCFCADFHACTWYKNERPRCDGRFSPTTSSLRPLLSNGFLPRPKSWSRLRT